MNKKTYRTNLMRYLLLLLLVFAGVGNPDVMAQEKMDYWRDIPGLLQEQSKLLFNQAYAVLDKYPPSAQPGDERKLALFALDALLHDTRLDKGESFYSFMDDIGKRTLDTIKTRVKDGSTRVLRLYNQGTIIQTPTVTIAFDLVGAGTAKERPFFTDSLMRAIVDQCDVLFVSHLHADHADSTVARMFYDQRKEVFVPTGLWEGLSPFVKPVRKEGTLTKTQVRKKDAIIKVAVFPGHQGDVLNNVYIVTTPEGKTIVHTGDQYSDEDVPALAAIGKEFDVDILFVDCWFRPMEKVVEGIDPALVVSGHENEMKHSIDHREAYWLTFRRIKNLKKPCIVMAWGENFRLDKLK